METVLLETAAPHAMDRDYLRVEKLFSQLLQETMIIGVGRSGHSLSVDHACMVLFFGN
jgi:hypothetical protein